MKRTLWARKRPKKITAARTRCTHDRTTPAPGAPYSTAARYTCDDCGVLLQFPFLEEGKTIGGRHFRRGPEVDWIEAPEPSSPFLKEQA